MLTSDVSTTSLESNHCSILTKGIPRGPLAVGEVYHAILACLRFPSHHSRDVALLTWFTQKVLVNKDNDSFFNNIFIIIIINPTGIGFMHCPVFISPAKYTGNK